MDSSRLQRATLIAETFDDHSDGKLLEDWLRRWRGRLGQCSENKGCGCCVDIFDVEAPQAALDELPAHLVGADDAAASVPQRHTLRAWLTALVRRNPHGSGA